MPFFIFFCLNGCFVCFFWRMSGVTPLCGGCRSGCLGVRTQGQTSVGMRRGIRCRWGSGGGVKWGCEEGMFGRVAAGFGRPMRCVGASGPFGMSKRSGASEPGMLHVEMSVCLDAGGAGVERVGASGLELVAHALDGDDMVVADFLAQLADVHVDGAVAHDHLAAPDAGVNLLAREELSGRGAE